MARDSDTFPSARTALSPLVPFLVGDYILKCEGYLHSHRFASIPMDGQPLLAYAFYFGANQVTAAGAWIEYCAHWCRQGTVLRIDQ